MAETLSSPSNTLVKVRWQEPYVSEGLNKKLNGLVPHGVIRGGRLGVSAVNSTVVVEADPDIGDSIYSVIDANGHQLTFRQVGDVSLDLNVGTLPGTTAYIGLKVTYSTGVATSVQWGGYTSAEIDADSTIVCLGSADVPGSPAIIPESDIGADRRTVGGLDVSSGMKPWRQLITNPSFEGYEITCDSTTGEVFELRGYHMYPPDNGQWHVLTPSTTPVANPRTGSTNIILEGNGSAPNIAYVQNNRSFCVSPGQIVRASTWIYCDGVTMGSGASGYVEIQLRVRRWDGVDVVSLTKRVDGATLSGTLGYFELSETFKMPADAGFVVARIYVSEATSLTGDIGFDDFRVWVEPGPFDGVYDKESDVIGGDVNTSMMSVSPHFGQGGIASPQSFAIRSIQLACENPSSASLEYSWKNVKESVTSWLMSLPKGVFDIGSDLISSAAEAIVPRLSTSVQDYLTARYTLLWQMPNLKTTANQGNIRIYATNRTDAISYYAGTASELSLVVTMNAEWNGSQWVRDESVDSMRYDFLRSSGFAFYIRENVAASPWGDGDWENATGGDSYLYFILRAFDTGKAHLIMPNAHFRIVETTATATSSNPAYNVAPYKNALYAKNMCKAWLYFEIYDNGFHNMSGFNLEPGTITTSYLTFSFKTGMTTSPYSVVATGGFHNAGATFFGDVFNLLPYSLSSTGFWIMPMITTDTSPSDTLVANMQTTAGNSNPHRFYIQVFSRQDS